MEKDVIIREARPEDFLKIISLLKRTSMYDPSTDYSQRYINSLEKDPDAILVAERTKKILGVEKKTILGVVFTKYEPEDHHQLADIYHGAIHPKYKYKEELKQSLMSEARELLIGRLEQRALESSIEQGKFRVDRTREELEKNVINRWDS